LSGILRERSRAGRLSAKFAVLDGSTKHSVYRFLNPNRPLRRNHLCGYRPIIAPKLDFCVKRLEGRDRCIFPRHIEGETVTIRGEQLEELLAGFDLWRTCQSLRGFTPDLFRMRIAAGSKSGLKLPSLATKLSVTR
jgi:hypothetical protein